MHLSIYVSICHTFIDRIYMNVTLCMQTLRKALLWIAIDELFANVESRGYCLQLWKQKPAIGTSQAFWGKAYTKEPTQESKAHTEENNAKTTIEKREHCAVWSVSPKYSYTFPRPFRLFMLIKSLKWTFTKVSRRNPCSIWIHILVYKMFWCKKGSVINFAIWAKIFIWWQFISLSLVT